MLNVKRKYYEHRKKTWITKNHQLLHFSFQIWYHHSIWIFAPKVGHFRDMIDFYYGRFFWRQFFAFLGGKMQKFVYAFEMLLFWEREGVFFRGLGYDSGKIFSSFYKALRNTTSTLITFKAPMKYCKNGLGGTDKIVLEFLEKLYEREMPFYHKAFKKPIRTKYPVQQNEISGPILRSLELNLPNFLFFQTKFGL